MTRFLVVGRAGGAARRGATRRRSCSAQGRGGRALQGAAAARRRGAEPVAHRVAAVAQASVGLRLLHRRRRAHRRAGGRRRRCAALRAALRVRQGARLVSARRHAARSHEARAEGRSGRGGDRASIAPYEPGKPIEELERELGHAWGEGGAIKLASNENPLGPSPLGIAAAQAALATANLYPDGGSFALRHKLAARHGVDGGADRRRRRLERDHRSAGADVLRRGRRGGGAAVFVHRLSSWRRRRTGGRSARRRRPRASPTTSTRSSARSRRGPRCLFFANPNNPTGAYAGARRIRAARRRACRRACSSSSTRPTSSMRRAADYPDARELPRSGARAWRRCARSPRFYGLAGLRVGYMIASAELNDFVNRMRLPFNVAATAQAAALRGARRRRARRARARGQRRRAAAAVGGARARSGCEVYPSQTNFVLAGFADARRARSSTRRSCARA